MLIAENHLQFIIEIAILIHAAVLLMFNIIIIPLSLVLFLSMVLTIIIAALFGIDTIFLFLPFVSHHEFTHPFGPLAVFAWVTFFASASLLTELEIRSASIKTLAIILFFIIAVAGGMMHRSFLLLWLLGWFIGTLLISRSFKRTSQITVKRVFAVIAAGIAAFGLLEVLSRILNFTILSPLLRITRVEEFAMPSLAMVIKNTTFWGHVQGSCYWGAKCLGGSDGYITLPMNFVNMFTLPFPLFAGILVVKKDAIDYMLPGIFGVAFDFGYLGLFALMAWVMIVTVTGLYILREYRSKRLAGSRNYIGREALLIGALTAFISQSIIGLFLFNRSFNGAAMIIYILLSALVVAHVMSIKRKV
ncbi:MAG: hypothetical protein F8N15_05550 [Methanobacterium sp.]|nr:hypothetical protein [Methanobacterium sp.]